MLPLVLIHHLRGVADLNLAAMAAPRVFHGARAKVSIVDPTTGLARVVGLWLSFDYNVTYDVQVAAVLGRFSPADMVTTGVEPVSITASGWRVVDHDAFVECGYTNIKDLLNQEFLQLTVHDRKTGKNVATIRGCLPTGLSSNASAKQLATMQNSYLGLIMDTETTEQAEAPDAAELPG